MTPDIRVHFDHEAFSDQVDAEVAEFESLATEALFDVADDAVDLAQRTTLFKNRTGELRKHIDWVPNDTSSNVLSVALRAVAEHASYVHDGTPAHTISGRNGGMLRFQINGRWVSKRSVQHPGTTARPFLQNAADAAQSPLAQRLEQAASEAFG